MRGRRVITGCSDDSIRSCSSNGARGTHRTPVDDASVTLQKRGPDCVIAGDRFLPFRFAFCKMAGKALDRPARQEGKVHGHPSLPEFLGETNPGQLPGGALLLLSPRPAVCRVKRTVYK